MNVKTAIFYAALSMLGVLSQIMCGLLYPIAFAFRHKILRYASDKMEEDVDYQIFRLKPGVKKRDLYLSPLFWGFLITTGFTDHYCGPAWFKKEQKMRWFNVFTEGDEPQPIPVTFKQKILYFWLSFRWGGLRNSGYAFAEWFFREGKAPLDTIKIYKCDTLEVLDLDVFPGAKFKDKDGSFRDNSGPYIRYTFDSEEKWNVTNEGTKIITFVTLKGKERFKYAFTKIYKLKKLKKFLVIELIFGWDQWDGMKVWHSKFMLKNMDNFALQDYDRYTEYIKNNILE